jgi:Fe-S cluster assembly ATPase SufC
MPKSIKNIKKKVVVFDLDETLGYFGQLGRFCNLLDEYYKNPNKSYSIFNGLMDLYPEFTRPNIINILKHLLQKKKENKCQAVMIYTNNTGERKWAEHIKGYFEYKLNSKIFEQIIAAFKINGKIVEINRTSHEKSVDDFFRCTKLPSDIEICFIDDLFHPKMNNDNVYYIHVKEYKHLLPATEMLNRYLNSPLSSDIKNKDEFKQFTMFNLKYNIVEKDKHEHEIDIIVSKKMLEHIKEFFDKDEPSMKLKVYNKNQKSFKKNNKTSNNNKTVKKK